MKTVKCASFILPMAADVNTNEICSTKFHASSLLVIIVVIRAHPRKPLVHYGNKFAAGRLKLAVDDVATDKFVEIRNAALGATVIDGVPYCALHTAGRCRVHVRNLRVHVQTAHALVVIFNRDCLGKIVGAHQTILKTERKQQFFRRRFDVTFFNKIQIHNNFPFEKYFLTIP